MKGFLKCFEFGKLNLNLTLIVHTLKKEKKLN